MKLEYMISDNETYKALSGYETTGVKKRLLLMGNSHSKCVSFETEKNRVSDAHVLSDINIYVVGKYKGTVTVLCNEAAEYFNKRLYPLAADFERKLRRMLYLVVSEDDNKKHSGTLIRLEDKTLNDIFELLFVDKSFIKKAHTILQKGEERCLSPDEILEEVRSLKEQSIWTNLFHAEECPIFVEKRAAIKRYRNDIMHSHNISYEDFRTSAKLFKAVNAELDEIMNDISFYEKRASEMGISERINESLDSFDDLFSAMSTENRESLANFANVVSSTSLNAVRGVSGDFLKKFSEQIYSSNRRSIDKMVESLKQLYDFSSPFKKDLAKIDKLQMSIPKASIQQLDLANAFTSTAEGKMRGK